MAINLTSFDAAEHLTDPADQADLLAEAVASGDPHIVARAIGVVARARGMSAVADSTGIARQALYRSFGDEGNPTLDTLLKVLPVLGIQMRFEIAA